MLIMNCDYEDRPNFAKKRYFILMAFLGMSSFYRIKILSKMYETKFTVEKHVESVNPDMRFVNPF